MDVTDLPEEFLESVLMVMICPSSETARRLVADDHQRWSEAKDTLETASEVTLIAEPGGSGDNGQREFPNQAFCLHDAQLNLIGVRGHAHASGEYPMEVVRAHACKRCEIGQRNGTVVVFVQELKGAANGKTVWPRPA
jgi:hypothetical protein